MTPPSARTPFVVVAGPLAAGKSAVSRRLADGLRADGHQLALVELDQIADMARPTLSDWADAHRIFASVTAQWLEVGLDLVIAESVSDRAEHQRVLRNVPAGTPAFTIVLDCDVDTALARARSDPSRGLSRDEGFLRRAHARWAEPLPQIPADLRLDSDTTSIDESVQRIRTLVEEQIGR